MADGLKVDDVELLFDEVSEDALAHAGARRRATRRRKSGGVTTALTRVAVALVLLACGGLSYPLAKHFGVLGGASDAEQEPIVVGMHSAGPEHRPVNVISGTEGKTNARMTSADDRMTSREKVASVRDGSEQLVPRGLPADRGEATNVKLERVAMNYKPTSDGSGVQVEQPDATSEGYAPKLVNAGGRTKVVVPLSQGRLLRFDEEVETVLIADPAIADVKVLSTREVYVLGKKTGITTLDVHSSSKGDTGEAGLSAAVQLYVGYDPKTIEPLPTETMAGPNQVNLRVRFAEINRSHLQALGLDWGFNVNAGSFSLGVAKTSSASAGANLRLSGGAGNFSNISLALEALQKNGMVNVLAEPNLTAVTGETASFLAGGEVPIPVVTGAALNSNNVPQVSVAYKTFGVSLQFTPTIIRKNRIAMRVRPEVSSVAGTADFGVNGVAMPTFTVRRTDTVVEVASGQTFAIAGLFQRDIARSIEKFPILGDIPVLGTLFQSESFKRNETELVILITPYLVEPVSDKLLATPLDKRKDEETVRPVRAEVDRPRPAAKQVDPGQSGFIYK